MLAMPAVLVGNHIGKRCCSCWFQLPEEDIETEVNNLLPHKTV